MRFAFETAHRFVLLAINWNYALLRFENYFFITFLHQVRLLHFGHFK